MYWYKDDDKMTVLQKARMCLAEFHKNITEHQRKLMSTGEVSAVHLSYDDIYERIRLLRYVDSLNKTINIHENMPPPQDPIVPLTKKTFEPTDWRNGQ